MGKRAAWGGVQHGEACSMGRRVAVQHGEACSMRRRAAWGKKKQTCTTRGNWGGNTNNCLVNVNACFQGQLMNTNFCMLTVQKPTAGINPPDPVSTRPSFRGWATLDYKVYVHAKCAHYMEHVACVHGHMHSMYC